MTVTDSQLRDNLKDYRKSLADRIAENEAIVGSVKNVDGTLVIEDAQQAAFQKNLAEIKTLNTLIQGTEATLLGKEYLSHPADDPLGMAASMASSGGGQDSRKTIGQRFIESEGFKSLQGGKAGYTMRSPVEMKVADLAGHCTLGAKDVYSDLPTGTPSRFGTVQRDALVGMPHRRTRVRDLFPVQNTNSPVIEYFRQTGFTNNASVVPERDGAAFAVKPHSTLTFVGEQTTIRTIAHWEAASRTVLADEPQLRGLIDTELLYGLQLAEDAQILSGTGANEDLPGILNDSDTQDYAWSDGVLGDNQADAIRRAITMVTIANYEATGIVASDLDWEDIELIKDENGQYLLAVSIALGGEQRLWRVPLVTSPAMPEGTVLVGAFGLGAQLYDREEANIRVAEQHSDFFIRNGVVVLAEERIGLAVKRPEAFVNVTLDNAPTT